MPSGIYAEVQIDYFARFLAKIALCVAVRAFGLKSFDPSIIRTIIKEKSTKWNNWLGGTDARHNIFTDEFLNSSEESATFHNVVAYKAILFGETYIVVQIQLFSFLDTPCYTIVVGKATQTSSIQQDLSQ